VTLPWWNQLWLNEGFATYFENVGAAALWNDPQAASFPKGEHPGPLNYMHGFPVDVLDRALRYDAVNSSHALNQVFGCIETVDSCVFAGADAEAIFTRVAYEKGGSVLRMLHVHMLDVCQYRSVSQQGGRASAWTNDHPWHVRKLLQRTAGSTPSAVPAEQPSAQCPPAFLQSSTEPQHDVFFSALSDYVRARRFSIGDSDELWQSMQASTSMPVPQWMTRWTNQQGVPLVLVSRQGRQLKLVQQRLLDGEGSGKLQCGVDLADPLEPANTATPGLEPGSSETGMLAWWLPIRWASVAPDGAIAAIGVTEMRDCTQDILLPDSSNAVKVNLGQFGVYRYASLPNAQRLMPYASAHSASIPALLVVPPYCSPSVEKKCCTG
jgi:Peptidase family M1 domain